MSKVESLYGTTPAEIFESGIENIDDIASVAAVVLWKNGTITAGWSNTDFEKLALMNLMLDQRLRRFLPTQG